MKTSLKLKIASLIVVERPLLSATIVVFFSAVIMMAISAIFQDFLLVTKIAKFFFWAIAILGIAHLVASKLFVTWFSGNKHRIPLLYYGGRARIYQRPIFKKVPFVEIIFPDRWNVEHTIGKQTAPLLLEVEVSDTLNFLLAFDLDMELFGHFQAKELENLISSQKAQCPTQKKFELTSCLEDFIVDDIRRNHHSIKYLLNDYHLRQINLKDLEAGLLQMVRIPKLFTNVTETKLKLTDARRMVRLKPTIHFSPFGKAAAVL